MQNLEPGQIVQVGGKDATVISVGDGIVHLEQDGQAISVHPGEITIAVGDELPPTGGEVKSPTEILQAERILAEIVALKQRVTALETQANRIEKVLAALTAGPKESSTNDSTAAPGETLAATVPADSAAEAGNAALPASE